ncbi:MAG: Sec-independent protein translocase protein TatB [Gammaproteobacteria bacterium]|nr:Sec-independent protein translocase protein TatB [Gammaproteobacteria bacterium]
MFDVGFWELALIGVVALIIVGPERLPGVVRTAGRWVGKGRRILHDAKADLERELKAQEMADLGALKKDMQNAGERVKSAAEDINQSVGAGEVGESLRESLKPSPPPAGNGSTGAGAAPEATHTDAVKGTFYIYENRRTKPHRAVLHAGACRHCNEGRGRNGRTPKRARWHGPFSTLEDARRQQRGMAAQVKKACRCVGRPGAASAHSADSADAAHCEATGTTNA